MQIVKEKRPPIVFLENVKHMIYHDKKRTIQTIIQSLEDEGYYVSWKVLNAKNFGLAQNRERLIIIASLKGKFDFGLIEKSKNEVFLKDILDKENAEFEYLEPEEYTILDKRLWKKQASGLIFCGYRNKKIRQNGVRENTIHLSRVHKQPNRIYHIDGTHPTLPSQETSGRFWIYDGERVRKLSIAECYRLMGFPEDYKKISSKGHLYKQIGNSVPINLINAVGNAVVNQLIEGEPNKSTKSEQKTLAPQLNLLDN
jgi:DNA (cytosine-5)-methyltransferase 1